jgi:hypothetical protein
MQYKFQCGYDKYSSSYRGGRGSHHNCSMHDVLSATPASRLPNVHGTGKKRGQTGSLLGCGATFLVPPFKCFDIDCTTSFVCINANFTSYSCHLTVPLNAISRATLDVITLGVNDEQIMLQTQAQRHMCTWRIPSTTHLPSAVGLPPLSVLATRSTARPRALPASPVLPSRVCPLLLEGTASPHGGLSAVSSRHGASCECKAAEGFNTSWAPST